MAKRRSTPVTDVFVDSSVLFSAVNSPTGGSSKLFTVSRLRLVTSPVVLTEVERNVRKKLLSYHLDRFFLLAKQIALLGQRPSEEQIEKAKAVIAQKDAVIAAEAKQSNADYLVTLDIKHFFTKEAGKFLYPMKVASPKMLLETMSP